MGKKHRAETRGPWQSTGCRHEVTTETVTAGLRRIVCEGCGHVSIRYEGETVRIRQELPPRDLGFEESNIVIDLTAQPRVSLPACIACGSTAKFYTPHGVACSFHAWEAACEQDADIDEFWIPIAINRDAL